MPHLGGTAAGTESRKTAANGDQLTFLSDETTGLMTITGGTGRFAGATGTITAVTATDGAAIVEGRLLNLGCATGHPSFVIGTGYTQRYAWRGKGTIKY